MLAAKLAPSCRKFRYRLSFSYILVNKIIGCFDQIFQHWKHILVLKCESDYNTDICFYQGGMRSEKRRVGPIKQAMPPNIPGSMANLSSANCF